jgi:hypothetical protein
MTEVPVVRKSLIQPFTATHPKHKHPKHHGPPEGPDRARVEKSLGPSEIGLLGELTAVAANAVVVRRAIPAVDQSPRPQAICGTEGVVVTSGYGKWNNIDRRQRTSLTILSGFDPYTITVPLILDGVAELESVEGELEKLEWMGLRGLLVGSSGPEEEGKFHPGEGETPTIEVLGKLVPPEVSSPKIRFVLTGIEYNMAGRELILPVRRKDGERVRQAVTLTFTQYNPAMGASQSPAQRAKVVDKEKHELKPFVVHDGINTFRRIAKHYRARDISGAAREIQKANAKLGASVDKVLKHGTKVKVPRSATSQRARA